MPNPSPDQIRKIAPNGLVRENGQWRKAQWDDKIAPSFAPDQPGAFNREDYLLPDQAAEKLNGCPECGGMGKLYRLAWMGGPPVDEKPCESCTPLRKCVEGLIEGSEE